jgi:hypothetical protein
MFELRSFIGLRSPGKYLELRDSNHSKSEQWFRVSDSL